MPNTGRPKPKPNDPYNDERRFATLFGSVVFLILLACVIALSLCGSHSRLSSGQTMPEGVSGDGSRLSELVYAR